jgi:hypothetical protein
MTTSIRYDNPYQLEASDAPPFIAPKPRRTGLIVGIIIAVIVVVIIIIVVLVLVLRKKTPTTPSNGGGGGSNPPPTGTCTNNTQCTAPKVCNVSAQRCVDCLTNAQCGGAFKFCRTDTNTCVACVTNSDCSTANSTCSNNVCCDSTPPVISNITPSNGLDPRVQLNLDIKQPVGSSKVLVILEDPTGFPLLNKFCNDVKGSGASISCTTASTCPTGDQCVGQICSIPSCLTFAAGAFILLIQSSIGIKLFTGASYRVRVKIVYDCGSSKNLATAFSPVRDFTMPACATLSAPISISFIEEVAVSEPNGLRLILQVNLPIANEIFPGVSTPDILVGFVIGLTKGFHPNRALAIIPGVQTMNGPYGLKIATVPHPGVGTFYARPFRAGGPDGCDGPLGDEFTFTTLGFDAPGLRTINAGI